jgi:hypothetical protein
MRRTVVLAVVATAAFAMATYEWPTHRARLAGGWFGVLGTLALLRLSARLRAGFPRPPTAPRHAPRWLRRALLAAGRLRDRLWPGASHRPVTAELARMEGAVVESLGSANGVHRRLRPVVRDIVEDQLAITYGLDLVRDTGRVRGLLGEEVWELVRPDRPFPADGFAAGMPLADMVTLVGRLERLTEAP